MSPRAQQDEAGGAKTVLVIGAIAALVIVLALVARARPRTELLDPASAGRSGSRALVTLLGQYGADVSVSGVVPTTQVGGQRVLVLVDRLSDEQRQALDRWVEAGGIAVIADPTSPDHVRRSDEPVPSSVIERGSCSIGALEHIRELVLTDTERFSGAPSYIEGDSSGVDDATTLSADGDDSCFGGESSAFVVAESAGSGYRVLLGENWIFSNQLLDEGDNAALGVALLAPNRDSSVVVLRGTVPKPAAAIDSGGEERLIDLIPERVWVGLSLLLGAAVLYAVARGTRTGRPMVERPLVPIEATDLVASIGNLMHRAGHASRAAHLLRIQVHRDLCQRFAVAPDAPLAALDHAITQNSALATGHVVALLSSPPNEAIVSDSALTDLYHRISATRKELL